MDQRRTANRPPLPKLTTAQPVNPAFRGAPSVDPGHPPFSWSGLGEELLVKPAGTFGAVLFLHLLRWLIRARRRRLALTLIAAIGPLSLCAGLMSYGAAQVFSMSALTTEAVVGWLMLLLVPIIFLGIVTQLETKWLETHDRNA